MSQEAPPALSVVMPAHNEESFLADAVREVTAGLRERRCRFELLVVENGSLDATLALAGELAAELAEVKVISLPSADYGGGLRRGFLDARGEIVANFDVDYYDLTFLDQAIRLLDGADVVVGTKRSPDAVDGRPWPRRLVTAGFAAALRIGFGLRVSDTHGMKAMRRSSVLPLVEASRFGTDLFDTELVIRAERAGLSIVEVGVRVEERRPSRSPIARRAARTVVGLVRLRRALGGAR